jgi:hypothetical protein
MYVNPVYLACFYLNFGSQLPDLRELLRSVVLLHLELLPLRLVGEVLLHLGLLHLHLGLLHLHLGLLHLHLGLLLLRLVLHLRLAVQVHRPPHRVHLETQFWGGRRTNRPLVLGMSLRLERCSLLRPLL